jgi:hypothetical protein
MAKQTEQQWAKVTETVALEDTGNILTPLIRVSMKYAAKAAEFRAVNKPELAKYYDEMTVNVDRIING